MSIEPEIWKDVVGYEGIYQGEFHLIHKNLLDIFQYKSIIHV